MSHNKVSVSPLGENPRRIKNVDSSFSYVFGEFAVITNMVILLENVDDYIHYLQMFADMAVAGGWEPSPHIFRCNLHFPIRDQCLYVDTATSGLALRNEEPRFFVGYCYLFAIWWGGLR